MKKKENKKDKDLDDKYLEWECPSEELKSKPLTLILDGWKIRFEHE